MIPALVAMLDTTCTVASVTYTAPVDGKVGKTPGKTTRSVDMRIQPISGRYQWLPEGKRAETTELGFADHDAALVEGEFVGATEGRYANVRWEVVHVNPVHGDHYEVALKRRHDLESNEDPLA